MDYLKHTVTEQDLIDHKKWADAGVKVGDLAHVPLAKLDGTCEEINQGKCGRCIDNVFFPCGD